MIRELISNYHSWAELLPNIVQIMLEILFSHCQMQWSLKVHEELALTRHLEGLVEGG